MRVLLISIAFPPKSDPECLQTAKYFRSLCRYPDLHFDVITSSIPTLFMNNDLSLSHYASKAEEIINVKIYESKYVSFLLNKFLPGFFFKPDTKFTFHLQIISALKKLSNKPDIIYSRSYPLSSCVAALKAKRLLGVPWIMHLSDPWAENPIHNYSRSEKQYHDKIEKTCINEASLVTFTSKKTLSLYKKKYCDVNTSFMLSPNVFEETVVSVNKKRKNNRKRIVYTGGLANTRNASLVIKALEHLQVHKPEVLDKFEVLFAGEMDRNNRKLFNSSSIPNLYHYGILTMQESIELQKSADLLLVIDSKLADNIEYPFFPSKLLDYAVLEIPILAITSEQSETSIFVKEVGGVTFNFNQVKELSNWLHLFSVDDITIKANKVSSFYNVEYQSKRLRDQFYYCLQ